MTTWPLADVPRSLGGGAWKHEEELRVWLDTLEEWNRKIDLTSATDPRALAWLMCADAWMLASRIPSTCTVLDVGTGAGAPGLALALERPDLAVTLVEPLRKRAAFLRTVLGKVGRSDVTLRDTTPAARFDHVMSRATFPPAVWLARGLDLVAEGGHVWLFLAREPAPADPRAKVVSTTSYEDGGGATKTLVAYARVIP